MQDQYGHLISYLRISITDRCNERCAYCMPSEFQEWLPRDQVMSYEEIHRVVSIASELGVSKIRITGGEPLTRKGIVSFIQSLSNIPGINDVGISTNGTLLSKPIDNGLSAAEALFKAGVNSVNVSLDTLSAEQYTAITGRPFLAKAIEGIDAARNVGFDKVKINSVLMRGRTENELFDLVKFAKKKDILLRFIEMMPVSSKDVLNDLNFLPCGEVMNLLSQEFGRLKPLSDFKTNGPASYYLIPGRDQIIGFIGAMTNLKFCESCNKLRLTCDGKLRPCLGSHLEFDLLKEIRSGATNDELKNFIREVVLRKPKAHDFRDNYQPDRKMIAIGG
ncbi:MAG: GTP 3',8-cyclase MoaA [Verrucomicrobiales bacterium]